MKVCGIVCEYNPLHQGHLYHIKKARELSKCDILIACMSGNFVQRGEFAIVDKWTRTKAALDNGEDELATLLIEATMKAFYDKFNTLEKRQSNTTSK